MNSKECLERLGAEKLARGQLIRNDDKVEPYINCIKQDLDKLEKVEKENKELRKAIKQWNINGGNLLKENIKLKKIIEILKSKKVSFELLSKTNSVKEYNRIRHLYDKSDNLSQEEYKLLKGILGND